MFWQKSKIQNINQYNDGRVDGRNDCKNGVNKQFYQLLLDEPGRRKSFEKDYIEGYIYGYKEILEAY